jgi:hypothetical protein
MPVECVGEGKETWRQNPPFRCRHRISTRRATPSRRRGGQRGDGGDAAVLRYARLRGAQARPDRAGAGGHRADGSGTVLWNLGEYAFIDGELAPATVNPSLWRMARLNMANGLFKVAERVYQLRGFDISNMTVLEGDSGLILIDPLTTAEVARAALAHYHAQSAAQNRSPR